MASTASVAGPTGFERIAVRAYFAWLAGSTAGAEHDWLEAEAIETALAERRAASAMKAAKTRQASAKAPTEMLVAFADATAPGATPTEAIRGCRACDCRDKRLAAEGQRRYVAPKETN